MKLFFVFVSSLLIVPAGLIGSDRGEIELIDGFMGSVGFRGSLVVEKKWTQEGLIYKDWTEQISFVGIREEGSHDKFEAIITINDRSAREENLQRVGLTTEKAKCLLDMLAVKAEMLDQKEKLKRLEEEFRG